jgi:hypothetical protein
MPLRKGLELLGCIIVREKRRKASGKKDSTVLKKILTDRKVLHLKNGGKVEKNDGRRKREEQNDKNLKSMNLHFYLIIGALCMHIACTAAYSAVSRTEV